MLGIRKTGANSAWQQFERMCASDLQLLPVDHSTFHHAALLALDVKSGLRSGDALHLAAALDARVNGMTTLDDSLAKNARQMKLNIVAI